MKTTKQLNGKKNADLRTVAAAAEKQVEAARKRARQTKAQFKQARKALKQAKKAAKEARKQAKALKQSGKGKGKQKGKPAPPPIVARSSAPSKWKPTKQPAILPKPQKVAGARQSPSAAAGEVAPPLRIPTV